MTPATSTIFILCLLSVTGFAGCIGSQTSLSPESTWVYENGNRTFSAIIATNGNAWTVDMNLDGTHKTVEFLADGSSVGVETCLGVFSSWDCVEFTRKTGILPMHRPIMGSALLALGQQMDDKWVVPLFNLAWNITEAKGGTYELVPNNSGFVVGDAAEPCHALLHNVSWDSENKVINSCENKGIWHLKQIGWMPDFEDFSPTETPLYNPTPEKVGVLPFTLHEAATFAANENSTVRSIQSGDWSVVGAVFALTSGAIVAPPCNPTCIKEYSWRIIVQNALGGQVSYGVSQDEIGDSSSLTPDQGFNLEYANYLGKSRLNFQPSLSQPMPFEEGYAKIKTIANSLGLPEHSIPFVQIASIPSRQQGLPAYTHVMYYLADLSNPKSETIALDLGTGDLVYHQFAL
jgi:hypothetical protein